MRPQLCNVQSRTIIVQCTRRDTGGTIIVQCTRRDTGQRLSVPREVSAFGSGLFFPIVCSKVCFLVDALIWTVSLIRGFDILCLQVGDAVQLLVESCEDRHPIRHTVVTLFVSVVLVSGVVTAT